MALPKTDDNITMSINSGTDPLTQAEEEEEFRVIKIEIVENDSVKATTIKAKLDSLINLKLENDIKLVEEKNDGRFEVLTWSATLLITLLALFITINFIVSVSKVREIVDVELDKERKK